MVGCDFMFEISRDMNPIEYSIKAIEQEQDLKDSDEKIEFIDNFRKYKAYNKNLRKKWCKYRQYHRTDYTRLCNYRIIRENPNNTTSAIVDFLKKYLQDIYEVEL